MNPENKLLILKIIRKSLLDFSNLISEYYGGKASNIDFKDNIRAAEIINTWVEDNTNGKIKNLIKHIFN